MLNTLKKLLELPPLYIAMFGGIVVWLILLGAYLLQFASFGFRGETTRTRIDFALMTPLGHPPILAEPPR